MFGNLLYSLGLSSSIPNNFDDLCKFMTMDCFNGGLGINEWKLPKIIYLDTNTKNILENLSKLVQHDGLCHSVGLLGVDTDLIVGAEYKAPERHKMYAYTPDYSIKVQADTQDHKYLFVVVNIDGVERYRRRIFRGEYQKRFSQVYPLARFISYPVTYDQESGKPTNSFFSIHEIKTLCNQSYRKVYGVVSDKIYVAIKTNETSKILNVLEDKGISFLERLKILKVAIYSGELNGSELVRIG